jgi:Flp pilus assembly protein TadD
MRKRFLVLFLCVSAFPSLSYAGADGAVTNYNLGLSFFSKNHFEQALSHFLEAADQNFNSWQSYEMAGYCYFEMRDKDSALEAFAESLKLNPKNAHLAKVYNNLKEGAAALPLRPVVDAGGFLPGT